MRCSCQVCGTYMVHSESTELGCVCPECGQRCKQCLGTNTVVSRDKLREAVARFAEKYPAQMTEEENGDDQYRD